MEQKLYDLMDWAGIEELTYSESADPHRMLGPHVTEEGLLIQAFIPTATAITVKLTGNGKKYPMIGMKSDLHSFGLLFFFIFKGLKPGFLFCPFHDIIPCRPMFQQKFFKGSEFTNINRSTFSLIINKAFCDIKRFRIFGFWYSNFHVENPPEYSISYLYKKYHKIL